MNEICQICQNSKYLLYDNVYNCYYCYGTFNYNYKSKIHYYKSKQQEKLYIKNFYILYQTNENNTYFFESKMTDFGNTYLNLIVKKQGKILDYNKIQKVISFL